MKRFALALALLTGAVPAAAADLAEIKFSVQQAVWLTHSKHGEGVVVAFLPSAMPDGGLAVFEPAMPFLCKQVAAQVMPTIIASAPKGPPAYLAIEIRSGTGFFGKYAREYFAWVDETCGAVLD